MTKPYKFKRALRDFFEIAKFLNLTLSGYRVTYLAAIMCTIVGALFLTYLPSLTGLLIDKVGASVSTSRSTLIIEQFSDRKILELIMLIFILEIIGTGLISFSAFLASTKGEKIMHEIRRNLLTALLPDTSSKNILTGKNDGEMITLFMRDVDSIWDMFGFAITEGISAIIVIVTMSIIVLRINAFIGSLLIVLLLSYSIFYYKNGVTVRSHFAKASPIFDRMMDFFSSSLKGKDTIISLSAQSWAKDNTLKNSLAVAELSNKAHGNTTIFSFCTTAINSLFVVFIWVYFIMYSDRVSPRQQFTIGEFVSLLMYLNIALKPMQTINSSAKAITKSIVSIVRIKEFLNDIQLRSANTFSDTRDGAAHVNSLQENTSVLTTAGLTYRPEVHTAPVLAGISLSLNRGEILGVTGPSGSGKSTLLKVIARIITPTKGQLYLEGNNYSNIEEDMFRRKIVYFQQEAILFPSTISENIKMGLAVTEEHVLYAAGQGGADFILSERECENCLAASLSGGEKQRIALARIFSRKNAIYIFDEPSTGLDKENIDKLLRSMVNSIDSQECIGIIISSHDPSILEICDRVIKLEHGRVVSPNAFEMSF